MSLRKVNVTMGSKEQRPQTSPSHERSPCLQTESAGFSSTMVTLCSLFAGFLAYAIYIQIRGVFTVVGDAENIVAEVADAIRELSLDTHALKLSPLLQCHLAKTYTVIVPARVLEDRGIVEPVQQTAQASVSKMQESVGAVPKPQVSMGSLSKLQDIEDVAEPLSAHGLMETVPLMRLPSPDLSLRRMPDVSLPRMPDVCLLDVVSGDVTPRYDGAQTPCRQQALQTTGLMQTTTDTRCGL